jgi:cholesterol oxidase
MPDAAPSYDYDYIVVGSGFGGSVAAHRLTEKGYRVAVMEMGRRWTPETLPRTNWQIWKWIWRPGIGLHGFFNMQFFRHVAILHGCAVGGGSITYASTSLVPKLSIWENGSWAGLAPWREEMPERYATVLRMLGVGGNVVMGPADRLLERASESEGVGQDYYRTHVAIFQGPEGDPGGVACPDPYFNGEGPARVTCIGCGGCMMGCRYGAKNTLDQNYLFLAEKHGAQVFPETKVIDVRPLNAAADGSEGYAVFTKKSTAWLRRSPRRFTCRSVVFAASALGTMDLLFRLKQKGSLPRISDQLGNRVRTNAESLIGVRNPRGEDMSQGVAIGSGVYIDEHTHIEATRYPAGSDALGLLATMLTGGRPGPGRIVLLGWNLAKAFVRHPWRTVRCLHPFGFARESVIMLCMQPLDRFIGMRLKRSWYWPFRKALVSVGERIPTSIPQANEFAIRMAKLSGGVPMSMSTEVLLDIPATAHILGGCVIGASPAEGVVDHRHRVFGYRNMYICDGSVIAANLGVNPSLTISALAERAMSFIPAAGNRAPSRTRDKQVSN